MAGHTLFLVKGSTFLPLTSAGVQLIEYVPRTPKAKTGTEDDFEPVTDGIRLLLYGTTTIEVQAKLHEIQDMIVSARRRQVDGVGDRVFLQYQPINDTTAWSAEILDCQDNLDGAAMTAWPQAKVEVTLSITRNVWEGPLTEARLSTTGQGSGIGGRRIYNCTDATRWNFADATNLLGVCSSPAKIVLTNDTGAAQTWRRIYIANYVYMNTSAIFGHMLQGEDVISGWGTPVTTTANLAAGGAYASSVFTSNAQFRWLLPSFTLNATRGKRFRLLARLSGYSIVNPINVQAILLDKFGLITLQDDLERLLPSTTQELIDLGELALPAAGWASAVTPHTLAINLRGVSGTVNLDYVQLTPAETLRVLIQRGLQIDPGDQIVDDGTEGVTYAKDAGGAHFIYTVKGPPLRLWPGKTNRIMVLSDEGSVSPVGNTFNMQIFYKPRRPTI